MRLVDRVLQSSAESVGLDAAGRRYPLPGLGAHAGEITACRLRYIIDRSASFQCGDLLHREPAILSADNPLLRAPAESFWMEWFEDDFAGRQCGGPRRTAVLAEAAPDGRSGRLVPYFEDVRGEAACSPLHVEFDLDAPKTAALGPSRFRVTHAEMPHLNALLSHAQLVLDRRWQAALATTSDKELRDFIASSAEQVWPAFLIMLAFSALLNDGSILREGKSDLDRLNAARSKRGRPNLLDHIEVSVRLGVAGGAGEERAYSSGTRTAPRLHYVRGHPVRRAGKTFWRAAHFRGDVDKMAACKTVRVAGGF